MVNHVVMMDPLCVLVAAGQTRGIQSTDNLVTVRSTVIAHVLEEELHRLLSE